MAKIVSLSIINMQRCIKAVFTNLLLYGIITLLDKLKFERSLIYEEIVLHNFDFVGYVQLSDSL